MTMKEPTEDDVYYTDGTKVVGPYLYMKDIAAHQGAKRWFQEVWHVPAERVYVVRGASSPHDAVDQARRTIERERKQGGRKP
jgi:hypothetical protein